MLRSRLQSAVPGLRIFLDVEDLKDVAALEDSVDEAQVGACERNAHRPAFRALR